MPKLPIVLVMSLALSGCTGDDAVPSSAENEQLDSAENLLNAAPDELDSVDERLPEPR
jgi:hypothetical protein